MLERFTVDVLAKHVATELLEGEPSPKLAHRFFRKGRRDGRKAYDHASLAKLLTDAVHLAGSTLVEELTEERRAAELRIAECQADIDKAAALAAEQHDSPQDTTSETGDARDGAVPDAEAPGNTGERDSSQMLIDALEARAVLRTRKEAEARKAQEVALQQARAAALDAAEAAATNGRAEIEKLKKHLVELPKGYEQRFESIKHTGELLWARYCSGFVQGEGRRGSRGSDVATPGGKLDFVTPGALTESPDQAEAEVD